MARLVASTYELQAPVARGPHGVLWRAHHTGTREDLLVKLLHPEFAEDPAVVRRFNDERMMLTSFLHPAVVRVRDMEARPGSIALVSELIAGTDLRKVLARPGRPTPEEAAKIAAACAEILAACHEAGVVHGDVKPTNILLEAGSGAVRMTDHRIARLARLGRHGAERLADPRYAAPEAIQDRSRRPTSDVYGIGLILHEMLTGQLPGPGEWGVVVPRDELEARLFDIARTCLADEPDLRPDAQSLTDALRDLAPLKETRHTDQQFRKAGRRRRWQTPTALGVAAVITVTGAVAVARGLTDPPNQPLPGEEGTTERTAVASATAVPVMPADAGVESAPGAVAFVRYWFEIIEYAATTGNTAPLDKASSPNCTACKAAIEGIDQTYANRSEMRGGEYTVRSVHPDSFFEVRRPRLRVVFDRAVRTTVDATGRPTDVLPGATFVSCQMVLERVDDRWQLLESQSPVTIA